jgi:adenylate cyclase
LNKFEIVPMADQDHSATTGAYFESGGDGDYDSEESAPHLPPDPVADGLQGNAFALPVKFITVAFIALAVGWGLWAAISHFGGEGTLASLLGPANLAAKTLGLGFVVTMIIVLPATISVADIAAAFRAAPAENLAPRPMSQPARPKTRSPRDDVDRGRTTDETAANEISPPPDEASAAVGMYAAEEEPLEPGPAAQIAEARASLGKFFEGCMAFVMASEPDMKDGRIDAITSFGCQLFFAGAAETLTANNRIDMKHRGRILEPAAMALGQDKNRARKFADKYESYLLEPAYLDMFRAGREAMQTVIEDERKAAAKEAEPAAAAPKQPRSPADDDFDDDWEDETDIGMFLAHALDSWRSRDTSKTTMTAVLFTDIVGSTSITQKHGDEASQRLLNIHNSIVRGALQARSGREVKHTGDGIMAAFSNPPAAIDAAIDMQRGVAHYNSGTPDIELRLRVGISVGEPIAEDNDLFGATVQMAARLCDVAGTDGIMITNLLKEMSQGRAVQYINVEPREFKGISNPVPVSLVQWQAVED